jgi:hypothetical protein
MSNFDDFKSDLEKYKGLDQLERFKALEQAARRLTSAIEEKPLDELSQLEREGIIMRFEYAFCISLMVIYDYLKEKGVKIFNFDFNNVFKNFFEFFVVKNKNSWSDMRLHWDALSKRYNIAEIDEIIYSIKNSYKFSFAELITFFKSNHYKPHSSPKLTQG